MSEYYAEVKWVRGEKEPFIDNKYSRGHSWSFDGGVKVPASSSANVVPLPYSIEANVDPEEAFVASISSCHMLFFLSIAAKKKFIINEYIDKAYGLIEKDENGKFSMTKIILRPSIVFSGENHPSDEEIAELHHQSHEQCYIANSVKTKIIIENLG